LKVSVLGAAKEVGRSAFLVNSNSTNILMDYGVLLKREPIFPMHVKPKDIDAVVIKQCAGPCYSANIRSVTTVN
jgi:putative mRNA 3-end processing factor